MYGEDLVRDLTERLEKLTIHEVRHCLLYTSDAADD